METSWWPDSHHSAPEQKCILCWQAPEAAPLILFPHLRTVCMFFWRIQDTLRQHSYICCSASTLLSLNSQDLSSYLSTQHNFPSSCWNCFACSKQHARTLLSHMVLMDPSRWLLHHTQFRPGGFPRNGLPCFAGWCWLGSSMTEAEHILLTCQTI